MNSSRKLQIGVMGSMADLKYSKATAWLAEQVGFWIGKKGATLIFGAEKDFDSLSTAACRGAKKAGGTTVGVTYGKGLDIYEKNADIVIASGTERGGGRELTLALSCDAMICLNGGSGTLTEIAIAYQAGIPIVVMPGTGGWSRKLANSYLDDRKRVKIEAVDTPRAAVEKAIRLALKSKRSKVLFLTAVHGDETIGIKTLKNLERKGYQPSWIVANEKGVRINKRFVETDLNRAAPGSIASGKYELNRAAEIIRKFSDYESVIDIHGTTSNTGIFTIVTQPTLANLQLACELPIKNVVIWSKKEKVTSGPLVSFAKRGIEIECGPKDSKKIQKQLEKILESIITSVGSPKSTDLSSKNLFRVYGQLAQKIKKPLRDFQRITLNGETFYPLLVNQYPSIVCYKMKKINLIEELSY